MAGKLHRRQALQLGAAAGLGYFFTGPAFSVAKAQGSNGKLYLAGIGVGGKGHSDIEQTSAHGEIIALCDVDASKRGLGWAMEKWPKAKTFSDYRKMFEDKEIVKTLDAFTCSTADHSHATASVLGMRLGKHVYTQKPLTRTVFEARVMMETAKKYKVCTQMGNQGSSHPGLRRAVELIQEGIIGDVKEVHAWTDRPREFWKQAPDLVARPKEMPAIPKTLDWDSFVGPSAMRPYAPVYTPHDWRGWWDFGAGAVGDMACHTANMAFRALKLTHPTKVSAVSSEVNLETCPAWAHMTFDHGARGDLPAVTFHWYEGKKDNKKVTPPQDLLDKVLKKGEALSGSGSILVGSKGILFSPNDYGAAFRLTPEALGEGKNLTKPEKLAILEGNNDENQKKEWIAAIQAGKPEMAYSNFDYASLLTENFLLGNVAVRTGKGFTWDGPKMLATGNDQAMQYIKTEFRKGWDGLEER